MVKFHVNLLSGIDSALVSSFYFKFGLEHLFWVHWSYWWKGPSPPWYKALASVCAVILAVPSHAAHRLHGQALGNHGLREYLVHDLSHPFAEHLWHLFWSKTPYVLALRKEYILLLVLSNIHLPCSHTCQGVLSALGCAHVVARSIDRVSCHPRGQHCSFPVLPWVLLGIGSKTTV